MRRIWYFGFRLESVICVCMKPVLSIVDYVQGYCENGNIEVSQCDSFNIW